LPSTRTGVSRRAIVGFQPTGRWWKVVEGGGRRWKEVEGGGRRWKEVAAVMTNSCSHKHPAT
jgi:hypothetical protein